MHSEVVFLKLSLVSVRAIFVPVSFIVQQLSGFWWNSRWQLSAILDFPKNDFWPMGLLRPLIFHLATRFGAKMIDAQIMAQNRNSRWRPSAILEFLYQYIGPPTKFVGLHQLVKFCDNPIHSFEDMGIWIFLQNWLEMPIYTPKISVFWGSASLDP